MVSPTEGFHLNRSFSGGDHGGGPLLGEITCCGYALEGRVLVLASSCYFSLLPGYNKVFFSTFFPCDVLPLSLSLSGPETKQLVKHGLRSLKLECVILSPSGFVGAVSQ